MAPSKASAHLRIPRTHQVRNVVVGQAEAISRPPHVTLPVPWVEAAERAHDVALVTAAGRLKALVREDEELVRQSPAAIAGGERRHACRACRHVMASQAERASQAARAKFRLAIHYNVTYVTYVVYVTGGFSSPGEISLGSRRQRLPNDLEQAASDA